MFYVGQNVVVAQDIPGFVRMFDGATREPLYASRVYTIRGLDPDALFTERGETFSQLGVYLEEVVNPLWAGDELPDFEPAYGYQHFRPLKDISEDVMNQLRAPLNERSKEVA